MDPLRAEAADVRDGKYELLEGVRREIDLHMRAGQTLRTSWTGQKAKNVTNKRTVQLAKQKNSTALHPPAVEFRYAEAESGRAHAVRRALCVHARLPASAAAADEAAAKMLLPVTSQAGCGRWGYRAGVRHCGPRP